MPITDGMKFLGMLPIADCQVYLAYFIPRKIQSRPALLISTPDPARVAHWADRLSAQYPGGQNALVSRGVVGLPTPMIVGARCG